MDLTLRQHIATLEEQLKKLNQEIMEDRTLAERNRLQAEIRAAEMALAHYRAALELEKNLTCGRPRA